MAAFSRSSALRVSNAKSRDARVENVGIQNREKRHTVSSHATCVSKNSKTVLRKRDSSC